ncbi:MAG: hypothetical protein FJW13_06240, partial [Actinobacteria bacterium]|nr:hypothetical protein [Actinomycetota bacterium]
MSAHTPDDRRATGSSGKLRQASGHTVAANRAAGARVPDPDDLERVRRGHIASLTTPTIDGPDGRRVFHIDAYDFLRKGDPAPDTVNPNLWRHAVLNAHHGLFEVCDGIWQVRGHDRSFSISCC